MKFDKIHDTIKSTPKWMNAGNWVETYALLEKGTCRTVFEARIYCSASGAQVGCRAWLEEGSPFGYGIGKAGGYGYDRTSAAFVNACNDMGIVTEQADYCAGFAGGHGMSGAMAVLQKALEQEFGAELVAKHFFGD